jgi:DNA-binding protein H-NS
MSTELKSQIEALLSQLSPEEQAAYLAAKKDVIDDYKQKEKVKVVNDILTVAKKYDFRVTVNIGEKYAAPKAWNKETGQTWHASGQKPKWLEEAIKAGKTQEDFAVAD